MLSSCPLFSLLTSKIAAVMNYVNTTSSQVNARDIIVVRRDGDNQKMPTISRLWEPLAYPLFFPHGTLGWDVTGNVAEIESGEHDQSASDVDGTTRQIMHYHTWILRDVQFQIFGRLTNEYVVDSVVIWRHAYVTSAPTKNTFERRTLLSWVKISYQMIRTYTYRPPFLDLTNGRQSKSQTLLLLRLPMDL